MTTKTKTMSEKDFDAKVAQINEGYEARKELADAYLDQEMARLFNKSGWTQQKIAEHVGKSRVWVTVRLRFGAFLEFVTTVTKLDLPKNFTERRFRRYWEQTSGDQRIRFRNIAEAIRDNLRDIMPSSEAGKRLLAAFGDWKWRTAEDMAEEIDVQLEPVLNALNRMKKGTYKTKCETKLVRKERRYRLKPMPQSFNPNITVASLAEDMLPVIKEGLALTRDTNEVRYSRKNTAACFVRLEKMIKELIG